jgi:peptidoglycan/xylan/chitin deacetylase (PgdA/CDA1 family)
VPSVRSVLKSAAERILAGSGLPRFARARHSGQCLVLAFHNVIAPGHRPSGDRPLHLPADDFERFLDALVATHDVVALDEIESPRNGRRPRAAITFDDAYAGALRLGVPALAARGLPATIFVAPGLLGRDACWWDRLAEPLGGLDARVRDDALHRRRGVDDAIMQAAADKRPPARAPAPEWRIATVDELEFVAARTGVTLGAHSWSHANLTALSAAELMAEMERPLAWLRERFHSARPWLAYPYGLSSPEVAQAAERAGYAFGFRVSGGWLTPASGDRWSLPRWNVPAGLSEQGFVLHAAGMIGD